MHRRQASAPSGGLMRAHCMCGQAQLLWWAAATGPTGPGEHTSRLRASVRAVATGKHAAVKSERGWARGSDG
jgi:hypothetical protein